MPNGLTVIVESMPWLRTSAFAICLPSGVCAEGESQSGLASLTCEMVQRGAAELSSRDIVAVQDNLGLDRSSGVSSAMGTFGAAMPADSLVEALTLYSKIVCQPHLPADQLDDAKLMAIQELRAMEDEPTQKVIRRLRELQFGDRLGRSVHGTADSVESLTHADVKDFFAGHYQAGGAILAVAGRVDPDEVFATAEQLFGDMPGGQPATLHAPDGKAAYEHFQADSSQTHIGFSFDTIPYGHTDYYRMRAGVGILSDGMSSRLFERVREQRGLCYTVSASCYSLRNAACVLGYAGTTPERAQETLDVTLQEIGKVVQDLDQSELDRWKVRIQSSLIMEQESSASRASSLASDHYQIGRVMSAVELEQLIEAITLDDVRDYWQQNPARDFRIVTLGTEPLVVPEISVLT